MRNNKSHIKHGGASALWGRRLTLLALCATMLLATPASVSAQSARVSINIKSGKLTTLFDQIQRKSGYKVFYSNNIVDGNRVVSITISDTSVADLLKRILPELGLSYKFIDNTIVLSAMPTAVAGSGNVNFVTAKAVPVRNVSGTIRDEKGEPVLGATVISSKDTRRGTSSGVDGSFAFNVPIDESHLIISMVGMETQRVPVVNDRATVKLKNASIHGDALVVTGFVPKIKNSFTGTATQVSGEKLLSISPTNTLQALKVFDPSFVISDMGGMFGSDPNNIPTQIEVRGASSIPAVDVSQGTLQTYTSLPVFIIDGFEVKVEDVYNLDINRVETVTILKDAAASSIYGSRASNGVIVIQTKIPKQGSLQVSYTFNGNISTPDLSSYNLMNSQEMVDYYKKMKLFTIDSDGKGNPGLYNIMKVMELEARNGVDTYWLSQPLRTSFSNDHSLIFDGGSQLGKDGKDRAIRYSVNLSAKLNNGVMKGSFRNTYTGGTKLIYDTRNLQFTSELQVSFVDKKDSPYGSFDTYTELLPIFRMKDAEGNLLKTLSMNNVPMYENYPLTSSDNYFGTQINPLYEATNLNNFSTGNSTKLTYRFGTNWEIIPDLRARASFVINFDEGVSDKFVSPISNAILGNKNDINDLESIYRRGEYEYKNDSSFDYYGQFTLSYLKSIKRHTLQAIVGGEIKESTTERYGFTEVGYFNDEIIFPGYGSKYKDGTSPLGSSGIIRTVGAFGTVNYSYDNRYMLDGSFRMDGSSNFASKQRISSFWSVGARWNLSNEKFMKGSPFSQIAIKANVGTTGNSNFSLSNILSMYKYLSMYEGITGAELQSLANPNLRWQTTLQRNIGIEIGILNNIVNIDFDYYYNTTKDNLTSINILPSTGFATYMANQGDVLNRGYEFKLSVTPFRDQNWLVNLFINGKHNRNKLVKISDSLKAYNDKVMGDQNNNNSPSALDKTYVKNNIFLFEEGKSLTAIYAVPSLGIDPGTGQEIFVTKSGAKSFIWDARDQIVVGDTEADFYGYFGLNVNYRRWSLNSSFEYSFGGDMYNQTLGSRVENPSMATNKRMGYNMDRRALYERWSKPGDIARYRGVNSNATINATSRFVQKNNYMRLNSLKLMYTLSKPNEKIWGFSMMRFSLSTNDLFYASTIRQERGLSYPYARQFYLSIQANF